MKLFRLICTAALTVPALAQFGVAGNKKKAATSFEQLNEMMKERQAGGGADGGADIYQQMQDLLKAGGAGGMEEAMKAMGADLNKYMEELSKLSPEEMQKTMTEAYEMMTSNEMLDSVVANKAEVLANLEATGLVSEEELAKYKADPEYFEEQMRGAFGQMKDLFEDPDLLKNAGDAMNTAFQDALSDPLVKDIQTILMQEKEPTDLELEEMRLKFMKSQDDADNSVLGSMFGMDDFKESLKDPKQWKESLLEGRKAIKELTSGMGGAGAGMGHGAGVGEL